MDVNKILWKSRGADKSALGAVNRPLRGCAAGVGYPNEIFKVHNRAPTPPIITRHDEGANEGDDARHEEEQRTIEFECTR